MKSRILYPKRIWFDKEFAKLSARSKVLCVYLILNENIGLIRTYHQSDREILFSLDIPQKELEASKKELEASRLFFFHDEWIYINNDFSYCDYEGRDNILKSKANEQRSVPEDVASSFESRVKGLTRGEQGVDNPLITPNPVQKTINNKYITNTPTDLVSDTNTKEKLIRSTKENRTCKESLAICNKWCVWEMGMELHIHQKYIVSIAKKMKGMIDEGYFQKKYGYKTFHGTLKRWVKRGIDNGEIPEWTEMEAMLMPKLRPDLEAEKERIVSELRKENGE